MEYFLLDKKFNPINQNSALKALIEKTRDILLPRLEENGEYYKKIVDIDIGTEEKLKLRKNQKDINKIQTLYLIYENGGKKHGPIDIVGKDTNLGMGHCITMELVTPPCFSIKELTWWVENLIFSTQDACNELGLNFILSAGHLNIDGNYCGEHHHIGISNLSDRLTVYNILRIFLPYLAVLSFSHFEDPGGFPISIDDNIFKTKVSNQFIRGCRLKNTQQIKPVAPLETKDIKDFALNIGLDINTCRMVDLYPFTDYETLEVRIFDTQISIARTIAMAILLQAICELALHLDKKYIKIINKIASFRYYRELRLELINKGLNALQKHNFFNKLDQEMKAVCKICNEKKNCNFNFKPNHNCSFSHNDLLIHNIISFLYFPRNFNIEGRKYGELTNKITAKDNIEQIIHLLKPILSNNGMIQSVPLNIIKKTLDAGIEPSMYWLLEYIRLNKNLPHFFKTYIEYLNKIKNHNTVWGIYYDPFFEQ
ncbi:MAG: hypothetical protein ACTSVK_16325 [Promethearchaeota archaeon]